MDTISLSDLGQSLIAIEKEIKSNHSSIQYYRDCIGELRDKNEALAELAKNILRTSTPRTCQIRN